MMLFTINEEILLLLHLKKMKIKTKHAELLSDSKISETYEGDNYVLVTLLDSLIQDDFLKIAGSCHLVPV